MTYSLLSRCLNLYLGDNFPLQQHGRDDTKYYSILDWIVGITDSTPDKARVVWKDFKRLHENAGGVVSLALPYLA